MTAAISVIIPSRLDVIDVEFPHVLWLDQAIESVRAQTVHSEMEIEIIVGLDHGTKIPERLNETSPSIAFSYAPSGQASQAAALNAAAAKAKGTYLAFLEDDDRWRPRFLEHALEAITKCEFVSSNQLEVPPGSVVGQINDFATPSGWFMRRTLWDEVGEMDTSYRYHLDNDWLGRLSDNGNRRVHLVEASAAHNIDELKEKRPFLHSFSIAKPGFNFVVRHAEDAPLVVRTTNPLGGMSMIRISPEARARSEEEQERLRAKFGRFPY